MSRSPKRHGLIVDVDGSWPLPDPTLSQRSSSSSLSASSSNEQIDRLAPSTPTPELAVVLPGFHFSTTDENVDPAEFHRIAAQLLSGDSSKRDSAVACGLHDQDHDSDRIRQLHCDLGRDPAGRYCCSCSKSYSTPSGLRQHISTCAGTDQHPCPTCDKLFATREILDQHIVERHHNNLEACPECGEEFPASYLPKHLARGLGGCDGMSATGPAPEIDPAYRCSTSVSPSQHFWIYDGDMSWQQSSSHLHDSPLDSEHDDIAAQQTMDYVQQLLKRPALRPNMEACELCGDLFSKEGDALARHVGEHSLDFAEKRHRCDDCRIYFANEKDLDRHLQSADLNHHCGFTFQHTQGACTGHHSPTYSRALGPHDHDIMQRHLWAWELSQLRLHRVTVARMLAERLSQPQQKRMSVQDCRRAYVSLLPHVSVANRDSMRFDASRRSDGGESEVAHLDAHFSKVLAAAFPEEDAEILEAAEIVYLRPDSSVIPKGSARGSQRVLTRKSFYDIGRRKGTPVDTTKQQGHKRASSGPIGFFRQHASREMSRSSSLHVSALTVQSIA